MYAAWGSIIFELLSAPQTMRGERVYDFAKQKPVLARPRLQWIAEDLELLTLTILWHVAFCDPQAQLDSMRQAAVAHRAMALVFGNGVHRGYYVVSKLTEHPLSQADDGTLIAVSADVEMTEYEHDFTAPPKPKSTPIGVVPATSPSSPAPSPRLLSLSPGGALPGSSVRDLGTLPLGSYSPLYVTPGSSALAMTPAATGAPTESILPGDVPLNRIARMEPQP